MVALVTDRIEEIRARAAAASRPPWSADESEQSWRLFEGENEYGFGKQILKAPKHGTPYAEYWPTPADAEFIVHAREDMEFLLQQFDATTGTLRQLAEHADALREALKLRPLGTAASIHGGIVHTEKQTCKVCQLLGN